MKSTHLILIFILLFGIASVNATYLDEISKDNLKGIQYFNNDSTVILEDFNFTIPKGFGLIENESVNNVDGNYTNSERFFANENGKAIMISASPIIRHDLILSDYTPCDVEMKRQTINGHDGIGWSMNNETYFIYFGGDYIITVGAPDNSYFEKIIQK